jgi:hypothetical protein
MAKDREGKFHPLKGKPSDDSKEGLGLRPTMPPEDLEKDLEMTDKYTEDADKLAPGVRMLHPNRNTSKQEDNTKENARRSPQSNKSVQQTFTEERSNAEAEELPGILYKGLFEQLAGYHSNCCISAYIPTHRAGMEVNEQQDRIAFKTLLQEVRSLLQEKSYTQTQIEKIVEPGYRLLREADTLWYNMTEGMAVFMSENYFKYVRLPFAPKQEILVNNSFYITPLIPAIAGKEHFYLLSISKRRARIFRVDDFYMEEIQIEEMPNGMEDVVHFEVKEDKDLFRGGSTHAGRGGIPSANYHGIGAGQPDQKESLALYLKEVDRVIWQKVLAREQAPLLLAGVDYLLPIYRSVSSYQYIWEDDMTGNFDKHSNELLYQAAKEKMAPFFEKHHKVALETYLNKLATPLTTSMPDAVIRSSFYGQVADLFVEKGAHIWGQFDAQNNQLQVHDTKQEGDDCLVDKAAIQTILHGGQVHLLDKNEMPNGSTIAALLRFQMQK